MIRLLDGVDHTADQKTRTRTIFRRTYARLLHGHFRASNIIDPSPSTVFGVVNI